MHTVKYFLPSHVYCGFRGENVVFLDLQRDDYLLVSGNTAAAIRALSSQQMEQLPFGSAPSLQELENNGLLCTDPARGKTLAPTRIEIALRHLQSSGAEHAIKITPNHIWHFVAACTTAGTKLRWHRIQVVIQAVCSRKLRSRTSKLDIARAQELVAIFNKLRHFFPRNYVCLYDSLALIEFLAYYGIFPDWVFGFQLEPWSAHCWVQGAGVTFNEGVEKAANYTPIMAI